MVGISFGAQYDRFVRDQATRLGMTPEDYLATLNARKPQAPAMGGGAPIVPEIDPGGIGAEVDIRTRNNPAGRVINSLWGGVQELTDPEAWRSAPSTLAEGGKAIATGTKNYLDENALRTLSEDAARVGKAVGTSLLDDPIYTAISMSPLVGDIMQANDVRNARREIEIAKRSGDPQRAAVASGVAGMALAGLLLPGAITKGIGGSATDAVVASADDAARVAAKFGQKATKEAARAKKVAQAAVAPDKVRVKTGKSKAVPADVYRRMEADQGSAAVLAAVKRGEHLKPDGYGGYVGAPRTVTSPQALGAMRRAKDQHFIDAVDAVELADPERLGTWYDRAKEGISVSSEPWQLPRVLNEHAVYSAGVSPESELGFSLKHRNSRGVGQPGMAYRSKPMEKLDTLEAQDTYGKLPPKIGEYRNKNDPRLPNEGLFGVNDFRAAQGFGYTTPDGAPWTAAVSKTMHPFMDAETALAVDRANNAGVGGRTDWQGPHLQEVPWVYDKAQDIYKRGKRGRFAGPDGIQKAIREANNTAQDYFYKHTGAATYEYVPGKNTGHVPQILDAPLEERVAYGQEGRWDQPNNPLLASTAPGVGEGRRDPFYQAVNIRQLPSAQSTGAYINMDGQLEIQPMTMGRPLLDFPTGGGGGRIDPNTDRLMKTIERHRALVDAQEAGAYNLPNTMGSVPGKNSIVLDARARGSNTLGEQPTPDQMAALNTVVDKWNSNEKNPAFGVTATNRGVLLFPFDPDTPPAAATNFLKKHGDEVSKVYPADQVKGKASTGYVPGVGDYDPVNGGFTKTDPYTGRATMGLLSDYAQLPPKVAYDISESEAIRKATLAKMMRDEALGGARGDIQATRQFLAEKDWPKVVDLIRKGTPPAAALAALGYSATAFASEGRQEQQGSSRLLP